MLKDSDGSTDIARLHSVWSRLWNPSFDTALESAGVVEVAQGALLPPETTNGVNFNVPFLELLEAKAEGLATTDEERELMSSLSLLATMICAKGGAELPSFLTRDGSLPPTKGDVVVFRALADGLLFLEHPAVLTDGQFNGWLQLATARNPVYRLVAARTINSVSSDLAQRSAVYRRLLNDSDPAIARIAVTGAARNVTPETSAALSEFRERQKRLGNADLAETAAKALARIEKRP